MRKILLTLTSVFLFFLPSINGYSQTVSVGNGDWTTPTTWGCTCVPDFNDGIIRIEPGDTVTISSVIQADQVIVSADATLIINSGGRLIIVNGAGDDLTQEPFDNDQGTFVDGKVIIDDGGILENRGQIASIASTMVFSDGAEYQHNQNSGPDGGSFAGGSVPAATWNSGSICRITGWTVSTMPGLTFRASLSQSFYDFIWDSPGQDVANVQLEGSLTTVNGDLIINNTHAGLGDGNINRAVTLGFNSTPLSSVSISILGDFIVRNASKVTLTSVGTCTLNVGGNVEFSSTAPNGATSPNHYLFTSSSGITNLNIAGDFILNSGQLNLSQTNGTGNITIGGNFELNGGNINKPGSLGTGNIVFSGSGTHNFTVGSSTFITANQAIDYTVNTGGTLNVIGNAAFGGNLTIQNGVTLNLNNDLSIGGDVVFDAGSTLNTNDQTITFNGQPDQIVSGGGKTLYNLVINKINETNVFLTSPLSLTGRLAILSSNSTLFSNGNLRLVSTSDAEVGNASIGPLLDGANVNGDVIVQRFMSSEGRIYRYLSSPVEGLSIADLQLYFPITGGFTGSSPCQGCTTNPSFYYYDALTAAYVPFPIANISEELAPGRGYSAFIRNNIINQGGPITLEMTGTINQGDIPLPVFHHTSAQSWNLVGNPYPSSINWNFPEEGWTKENINGAIAVRDNGEGGTFQYWNGVGAGGLENGRIAAGQAFWIETNNPDPELIIHETAKTDTTGAFFRQASPDLMIISLSKGNLKDKAYFQIHKDAALDFDYYDASKLVNDNFDLSTRFENTSQLAINAVNEVPCDQELLIDIRFTKTSQGAFVVSPPGNYTLDFEILGSILPQYRITLLDLFTGTQTDITNNSTYPFSITDDPESLAANRLKLVFKNKIDAEISIAEGDILSSNFETGNQWFLNDQKIKGANDRHLKVDKSGVYRLEVSVEGCLTRSQLEYSITSTGEEGTTPSVQVYPNPSSKEIFVILNGMHESASNVSVINNIGKQVGVIHLDGHGLERTGSMNVENLADGIYFLKAVLPKKTLVLKWLKQSK